MVKDLLAVLLVLGAITIICWLAMPNVFATLGIFKSNPFYQGGLFVSIGLPIILFGFMAFLGLALYLKGRE